ncbi:MAG TPA: hypothetical protein PLI09_03875 [Candidatus Hydrogenedentes bacterium]|nr:hypothetical protein [Candidatus Hydrogenedentota bacterium]
MNTSSIDDARAAKAHVVDLLRTTPGLTGVGITRIDKGYGVKVNLTAAPTKRLKLPDQINGVPIRFEVTGPLRKRAGR